MLTSRPGWTRHDLGSGYTAHVDTPTGRTAVFTSPTGATATYTRERWRPPWNLADLRAVAYGPTFDALDDLVDTVHTRSYGPLTIVTGTPHAGKPLTPGIQLPGNHTLAVLSPTRLHLIHWRGWHAKTHGRTPT